MKRKNLLVTGEYYHVFNKSIAGFRIFNNKQEFIRMLYLMRYYQWKDVPACFSHFTRMKQVESFGLDYGLFCLSQDNEKLVQIIAFCLMPTHVHVVVEQVTDGGISIFMSNILNSYSRYFNRKYKRLGPLWVGRFKGVSVETDDQMLHLSRYVHLNPTTANLVKKPEFWTCSSYLEYLNKIDGNLKLSCRDEVIDMSPVEYKQFVDDQIGYQKELKSIQNLILE